MSIGLEFKNGDFSRPSSGVKYISGKERNIRNFRKMLQTQSGDLVQVVDTKTRYNPQYGLEYNQFYGSQTDNLDEIASNVKTEVENACEKYIQQQKRQIEYLEESEVFVRYVVIVEPISPIEVIFTILLWTAEDVRLNRNPSFEAAFST